MHGARLRKQLAALTSTLGAVKRITWQSFTGCSVYWAQRVCTCAYLPHDTGGAGATSPPRKGAADC
jgi:hypothetical protein